MNNEKIKYIRLIGDFFNYPTIKSINNRKKGNFYLITYLKLLSLWNNGDHDDDSDEDNIMYDGKVLDIDDIAKVLNISKSQLLETLEILEEYNLAFVSPQKHIDVFSIINVIDYT